MKSQPTSHMLSRIQRRAQSGQAIVLIALMMVGLLGMAGLALDGGSLLLLQRQAQKVADLAAMSAAIARCEGANDDTVRLRAFETAEANEVDRANVQVSFPSSTDTEVIVRLPKDPYFIQLVYDGPMTAQGRSVTRCSKSSNSTNQFVLFATSTVCEDTMHFTSSRIDFEGEVWTNRNVQINVGSGEIVGKVYYANEAKDRVQMWTPSIGANRLEGWQGVSVDGYPPPDWSNPNDNSGAGIIQRPPQPAPLLFNIDDFRPPDGAIWKQIPPERRFHIQGADDWHWPGTGAPKELPTSERGLLEGLIFVEGSLGTQGGGDFDARLGDGLTIVATGNIRISGNNIYMKPYWGDLQIMAGGGGYSPSNPTPDTLTGGTCSGGDHVQFNTANFIFEGLLYVPWGRIRIPVSSIMPSYGQIIAYTMHLNTGSTDIRYRSSINQENPPVIYYVE